MVGLPHFSDKEIAVISFVRSARIGAIALDCEAEQVAAIRAMVGDRGNQWTADELEKIPRATKSTYSFSKTTMGGGRKTPPSSS